MSFIKIRYFNFFEDPRLFVVQITAILIYIGKLYISMKHFETKSFMVYLLRYFHVLILYRIRFLVFNTNQILWMHDTDIVWKTLSNCNLTKICDLELQGLSRGIKDTSWIFHAIFHNENVWHFEVLFIHYTKSSKEIKTTNSIIKSKST